jgi:hypothetical protein
MPSASTGVGPPLTGIRVHVVELFEQRRERLEDVPEWDRPWHVFVVRIVSIE